MLHVNDKSSPLTLFLLFSTKVIILLVVETNQYYHNLDTHDNRSFPVPTMTEHEMYIFLAIMKKWNTAYETVRQIGHNWPVLPIFLQHYNEMRQMPTHPLLLTLYK
jgi:hypothetical protein